MIKIGTSIHALGRHLIVDFVCTKTNAIFAVANDGTEFELTPEQVDAIHRDQSGDSKTDAERQLESRQLERQLYINRQAMLSVHLDEDCFTR